MKHMAPDDFHALTSSQRADLATVRGEELTRLAAGRRLCTIDGCARVHKARGFCDTHYARWLKNGDPGEADPIVPVPPFAATAKRADLATRRREERFEDVREMISWRVHPDEIARRIGASRAAIERQARNWGALDIARHMSHKKAAPTKPCPDCGDDILTSSTRCVDCALIARWAKGAAA